MVYQPAGPTSWRAFRPRAGRIGFPLGDRRCRKSQSKVSPPKPAAGRGAASAHTIATLHAKTAPGMRIGLLGGSFNPAHEGHRHISLAVCKRLGLDAVWWLVTPQNPLKERDLAASWTARLAQARAVARHPRLVVSGLEARLGTRFTAGTLAALKQRFPGVHFVWIMGADNLAQLPRWRRWTDILALMPVAVVDRPGHGLKAQLGKAAARFRAARWPEADARAFALARPPAWIYLHTKLHPQSATGLRRQGTWPGAAPSHPKPRSIPP